MAWTTPRTWVTGETVTSANMNTHIRDNLLVAYPDAGAWSDWTPTLTGITQGTGTVSARYRQVGKLVNAYFVFTFGTGSAISSGIVSLPATASGLQISTFSPLGTAHFHDTTGPTQYAGIVRLESTTTIRPLWLAPTTSIETRAVTSTTPFTWAAGDRLAWQATYEAL